MDIITYALCRKNGGGGGGDNTHFIGTTTTAITDGATTNPITVDGESYTAVKGDIIIYDGTEFIFDGSAWQSFGGTMDAQPTQDSAKAVTSDGVYRYTAGQKEYVNNDVRGEIFNVYTGQSKNVASGRCSHAEGSETKATTQYSHAEGYKTKAQSVAAHAEGSETTASGSHSHAEGSQTRAQGAQSHAEGLDTSAEGAQSHSEGTMAHAYGAYSHVEGTMTHTYNDSAAAHAEGYGTGARGAASHSEGSSTQANGDYSHAEGYHTEANGYESHAEGYYTEANAQYSHASGNKTIANTAASTVVGKFNVADGTGTNDPKHLFIVGNGTADNARSNILEVSDTYLNLNGIFKQNGQVIDFSTLGDEIVEMSDIEYDALVTKDPDKVYFVYEVEEDNRSIVCKDSNGNWKYTTTIIGTTASNITDNVTAEESTVTTPPTPGFDYWYGNIVFKTETPEKTVYHSMFYFSNDGRCGMRDTASGDGAPDAYFELGTYGSITYHPTPSGSPVSGLYVFSSSHRVSGDTIEFNVNAKPNGFKRIYMGDELYATNELPDITPHVELTQSQYDALQNPDPNTEYFITNADASGDFSSIEDRMTAIEDEYTIVYMDGNVRIPLYTRNVYKVVRVDGNTVEWYIAEPTSQRNFKATVTATGSAGTRTNPTVTVTEVV